MNMIPFLVTGIIIFEGDFQPFLHYIYILTLIADY
jgi:hypothetical protein